MDISKILSRVPLFGNLKPHEIAAIAERNYQFVRFKEGDAIIREDELDKSFYILLQGEVMAQLENRLLKKIHPGDVFGELAFLTKGGSRTSNVIAATGNVLVMKVTEKDLAKFGLHVQEKIKEKIIQGLLDKFQVMNREVQIYQNILFLIAADRPDSNLQEKNRLGFDGCHREKQRFDIQFLIRIKFENGFVLKGRTRNFNTAGAFVITYDTNKVNIDDVGVLTSNRTINDSQVSIPCQITRKDVTGISIKWLVD